MRIIGETKFIIAPITEESNLYTDLGYDSLGFISLLLKIEEVYSIRFELLEMGECLQVSKLIALVKQKVKEQIYD